MGIKAAGVPSRKTKSLKEQKMEETRDKSKFKGLASVVEMIFE